MESHLLQDHEIRVRCDDLRRRGNQLPEWKWTETDWSTCKDYRELLILYGANYFKRGKSKPISSRKKFLVAAACCREIWRLLSDERLRMSVRAAEQYADGQITIKEKNRIQKDAAAVASEYFLQGESFAHWRAANAACSCASPSPLFETLDFVAQAAAAEATLGLAHSIKIGNGRWKFGWSDEIEGPALHEMRQRLALIFKDIAGNPFRKILFSPAWRTSTIMALVHSMLENPGPYKLTALADKLEHAGCTNPHVLTHCRQSEEHFRGCWVLDGLLGVK